jgi:mRNA m6A methyltransferase catalytic subunit
VQSIDRQVALPYKQLHNRDIINLPMASVQSRGFLFMWVINSRYSFALEAMRAWGYKYANEHKPIWPHADLHAIGTQVG